MDLSKLSLGDKIAAGGGLALVLFALILDWHRVCFGGFCTGLSMFSGDGDAIPLLGFLAFLLALVVLALVLLPKLFNVTLPDLPIPNKDAVFYAAAGAAALLLIKLLLKFEYIGFGAYLMVIAAGAMAYGGFLIRGGDDASSTGGGSAPF